MNENAKHTPDVYDTCGNCGAALPESPLPYSEQDHGFCTFRCMTSFDGPFRAFGGTATALAEHPGKLGGPGFERPVVREWLDKATPSAPAMLFKADAKDTMPSLGKSWDWQLWSGGVMRARRFTRRAALAQVEGER